MSSTGLNSNVPAGDSAAGARADIVVALTSHNDARTIGAAARALQDGLARAFEARAVRFVLADAGSTDGTREAAREAVPGPLLVEPEFEHATTLGQMPYHGQPGRAAALRAALAAAHRLDAHSCAVFDASMTIDPVAIERLVGPLLADGFDYVAPYYVRHVNEGAITRGIVYPMFRALYGARLHQPAVTEFACSGRLLAHYLEQDFWGTDQADVGVDLWLAVEAVCGGFRACEAALGRRRAAARTTPAELATTLAQIVGALFAELENRVDVWQRVRGSAAVPLNGAAVDEPSQGPTLNLEALAESFRLGYRELREIWRVVLPPRTIVELRKLAEAGPDRFEFDDRLWATIIYDFAFGYGIRALPRDHLLRSLTPLYAGWLASFARQMHDAPLPEVEARVEALCLTFEAEKRYLISRWRWPERLR